MNDCCREAVRVAVEKEREACALLVDKQRFNTAKLATHPMQSEAAYQALVAIRARGAEGDASAKPERRFPIIVGIREPTITIPWSVAARAYVDYVRRFGAQQTLERIAERGGFGSAEMDELLPGWRAEEDATPDPEPCIHGRYYLATMTCIECGAPVKAPEGSGKARYTGPIGRTPPKTGEKERG